MAIISKIRQKSGLAVTLIVISLILFLVGGDLLSNRSMLKGSNTEVGEVAGKEIDLKDYQAKIDELKGQFSMNNRRNPSESELNSINEQAWNQYLFDIAYKEQFDKLGIEVTPEEQTDMVQGVNIHPGVRQAFTNPETGEFDKNQVIGYLQSFAKLPAEQQYMWNSFEKQLVPERLRTKYEGLFSKSVYVTKEEAKRDYTAQNDKASARFAYVPFYAIPDSSIKVSESDIADYISKHKSRYQVEEGASIEYVTFPIIASGDDSVSVREEIAVLKGQFRESKDDSAFVRLNSDGENNISVGTRQVLPASLTSNVAVILSDSVYGPFAEGNSYKLYKSTQKGITIDSAKASHILVKDSAKAAELIAQLKGGSSFEELAKANSTDPGSAQKGGDLGWFSKETMVPEFSKAVFESKNPRLVTTPVKSQFGYHIIKVTAPIRSTRSQQYTVFTVEKHIVASDETRDKAYARASAFQSDAHDGKNAFIAAFKKDSVAQGLLKFAAANINKNGEVVNNLTRAREIVRWAYTGDAGDVSTVFEAEGNYVVAFISAKREKGTASPADVKEEVTFRVRNEKKAAKIIEKLGTPSGTLEAIATKFGPEAVVYTADGVTLAGSSIPSLGYDPVACGKLFGLKNGQKSKPFQGENGVVILEKVSSEPAPEIADYTQNKNNMLQNISYSVQYGIGEAIKENAEVEDNRYKFF